MSDTRARVLALHRWSSRSTFSSPPRAEQRQPAARPPVKSPSARFLTPGCRLPAEGAICLSPHPPINSSQTLAIALWRMRRAFIGPGCALLRRYSSWHRAQDLSLPAASRARDPQRCSLSRVASVFPACHVRWQETVRQSRAAPVALRLVESLRSAQGSSPRSALRSRVRMTLCRRGMDSNHRYQEDKRPLRDGLCLASAAKQ